MFGEKGVSHQQNLLPKSGTVFMQAALYFRAVLLYKSWDFDGILLPWKKTI